MDNVDSSIVSNFEEVNDIDTLFNTISQKTIVSYGSGFVHWPIRTLGVNNQEICKNEQNLIPTQQCVTKSSFLTVDILFQMIIQNRRQLENPNRISRNPESQITCFIQV